MTIRRPTTTANRNPSRPKFEYRSRTADDLKRRAQQGGTAREGFINQDVKFFIPKAGDNRIRIMPPTWVGPMNPEQADHFGYEVFVHYGIGSDDSSYLCLDKMKKTVGECPICAERSKAEAAGDDEYAKTLRPGKRVCVYVVDRDRPNEGVLLWSMPWTIDRDICSRAVDKMTGEVYNVDDPELGYDVSFTKEGTGMTTKYVGIDIARRNSPLSDDPEQAQKWLDYVTAHPIPDQLIHHDAEHIAAVFSGQAASAEPSDAPERQAAVEASATTLAEPTGDDILAMSEEVLVNFIEERELVEKLGDAFSGDLPDLKRAVCDLLWPPKIETRPATPSPSLKDRLARLRGEKK